MTEPEFEWYDYRPIRARAALWEIVAGPRSIGKTYGAKLDAVKRFLRTRKQTIWLRRTKTELIPAKSGFFDSIAPLYPGFEFRVEGDLGQIKIDGDEWLTMIRFIPLSLAAQYKGTEFPEVVRMVYDECFIDEDDANASGLRYLPGELDRLRSLWITVNRSRTDARGLAVVHVTLLGNARTLDNPYFLEWDFDGSKEWQKGRETGGDVVLHLIDAKRYARRVTKTVYGNVLGTVAIDYGDGHYFPADRGYVVDERPADSTPFATLRTLRGTFGLWLATDYSTMFVTVGALAAPEAPVVAFERMAAGPGVQLVGSKHFIRRETQRHYRRGSVRLVTPGAMAARQALAL